ncbi:SIS domain-containing protein [Mycetocola spongiae]|uniref:SIS domain-containing protein n=1 Tax=Mycetocola spongiae TaxID=2859226 RepID=UPI001CF2B6FE|nr:hypothetical protein [Mycetocola spongiae]UCR88063.1 hypothetical protein KXZ72_08605 [Mycetocola spongiae]
MSIQAFLRQGFIPFNTALETQWERLDELIPALAERAAHAAGTLGTPGKVALIGIGASLGAEGGPAHYLDAHGIPARRVNSGGDPRFDPAESILALSQSGRSRETVEMIRRSERPNLAVVNVSGSPLAQASDAVLELGDLSDSLASTIGYTASAAAVSMLAETWVHGAPRDSWSGIGGRLAAFLAANTAGVNTLVGWAHAAESIDLTAPEAQFGGAEAGALLLREVTRIPTAAFETRQYLHGLMESTRESTIHLVYRGEDNGQVLAALTSLGRRVLDLCPAGSAAIPGTLRIEIPALSELEVPLYLAALLQRVASQYCAEAGIDPDEFLFLDTGTKLDDNE